MRHKDRGGPDRHPPHPDHRRRHHRHGHGKHHGGSRRLFAYGELRLLLLAMIAERPRHGYELIKEIGERFSGVYSPSPGVIYPTLAWLDDMGYAALAPEASGRKPYHITPEGEAFLVANRVAADELLTRLSSGSRNEDRLPASIVHAMQNLKRAMRLRLQRGPIDQATADTITAALDAAAQTVEQSE